MGTRLLRRVGLATGVTLILGWSLLPVVWVVSLSLKTGDQVGDGAFLPVRPSLTNYTGLFTGEVFLPALVNSLVVASLTTLVAVVLATLAAYAVARLDFPGRRLLLSVALAVTMFPTMAMVGPLFDIWRDLGLYDTWLGLVIPYTSFALPLATWLLVAFFRQVPWELEEAAQLDGCTRWQALRQVIVPLTMPAVVTAAILTFLASWGEFVFAMALTSDAARTAPAALAFFSGESQYERPHAPIAAAAVVITVPVLLVVLALQKRIVAGLTSGAVKG